MGRSKRGQKPKISWYYMSIQFGICHGIVDVLNQIWIKEKEVFSAEVKDNTIIFLNDNEAWGGEEKEGGISGVVEYYKGTATQELSQIASSRFGRTTATMPGYRGVSHIFMRGYEEAELGNIPETSAPGGTGFFGLLMSAFTNLFDPARVVSAVLGFQWTANNPYLPGTWAHVTRIGKPFAPQWAGVPFMPGEFFEFPITAPSQLRNGPLDPWINPLATSQFDLSEIAVQVDSGIVVLNISISGTFSPNNGAPDPGGALQIFRRAFDANGNELNWSQPEGGPNDGENFGPNASLSASRTVPVGTRTIRYVTRVVFFPLGVNWLGASSATLTCRKQGEPLSGNHPRLTAPLNMNPAHIIAECLTNRVWGMGRPLSALDLDSFEYAAELFFNEYFGLSMQWREQMAVEAFIQQVLDHCQATMFLDPRTGLYTLVPIRGDYNPTTLPVLTEDKCITRNRQRKGQGEIINEVIITYTDHRTEEEKTVTFHDIAGVSQLGQIVSETRTYYGIRDPLLANVVGARDIRSASYPLFTCDVEAHRSFGFVRPGSVLKLNVAEDGIEDMIVRVTKVDYGTPGDRTVRFSVTEDMFALERTTYAPGSESLWENPDRAPTPLAYERLVEVPLPMLFRAGIPESDLSDSNFPDVVVAVLGNDPSQSLTNIAVHGNEVRPNGSTVSKVLGPVPKTPTALLPSALSSQASSTMTGAFVRALAFPQRASAGDFLYIDGPLESGEFVMLDSYNSGTDVWTVARGMFDTVPRAWPAGSLVWFAEDGFTQFYPGPTSANVEFTAKLLPRTSGGLLRVSAATAIQMEPVGRPYRPFRPANCAIGGVSFGQRSYSSNDPGGIPNNVLVTWANRNRTLEDGTARKWTEANVTPEAGQTVRLRFYERFSQDLMHTISGLTGTSYTLDLTIPELEEFRFYDVEFLAVLSGDESIQGHRIGLDLERLGYGNNYGYDYGQNDGDA